MTKRKDAAAVQAELPMKDVTPKADPKPSAAKVAAAKSALPKPRAAVKKDATKKPSTAVATVDPKAKTPAISTGEKSFLQVIVEAAGDPRCDVGKMQALLNMQKEIVAEERRMTFDTAFIALQAELPVIDKDGKIEVRKEDASGERTGALQPATPYATFDAIMDAIQPLLTKHGFGLSFETEPGADRLNVRGILNGHGHERRTVFPLPAETSGSKNNVQGWGSSLSYGKRYCTIALLNIRSKAPQDRDTDGFPGDFQRAKGGGLAEKPPAPLRASEDQLIRLREAIEGNGVPEAKVLDHYGIAKLADIESRFVDPAIKQCQDYAENQRRIRGGARG
jgi:hypothetical protein